MQKRKAQVLISIVLAMLVASLDQTIMNTTMPIISEELGGLNLYAWSFATYMIMSTVMAPIAGRISDIHGRKTIFAVGIVLFMIGSLLCGFSHSMLQLVIFRGVQGIGAGIMNPFPIIIAGDLFPVEKRGKIQALFSTMWGISSVIAPLLGALFTDYASWRWIFYINVPICILCLIFLFSYEEEYEPKRSSIDYGGALLFTAGIGLVLTATVVEANPALYLIGGFALIAIFVLYERRHVSPIIPLSLLSNRPIRWFIIQAFFTCASLMGTSSYIPYFLQNQGYSTFLSGLVLLGQSAGWMLLAVPAGKWIVRFGYTWLMIAGSALLVISGVMLFGLEPESSYLYVTIAMTVQGLAFGLLFTVSTIGSQELVGSTQKGISTSIVIFSRNIGTAVGVTVMGSLLNHAESFMEGIQRLFLYGMIISLLALAASFPIRNAHRAVSERE